MGSPKEVKSVQISTKLNKITNSLVSNFVPVLT